MAKQSIDRIIIVADVLAVLATVFFIIIAVFTKDPCFSLVESYGVVTPVFTSYFGRTYKLVFMRRIGRICK